MAPYTPCLSYIFSRYVAADYVPEQGKNILFTIESYAYVDEYGRETVTWLRMFHTNRIRRFDADMIDSAQHDCIIDYMGTHKHFAVDVKL